MILITGGAFQGKLEAAKALFSEKRNGKEPLIIEGSQNVPEQLQKADIIPVSFTPLTLPTTPYV